MDAGSWLRTHANLRTEQERFACLEGCGFCCTYPPQLDQARWDAISQATGLKQVGLDPQGGLRLPLQGGCGGCALLEQRACTAYELRPAHCRYFPFHVYFGRVVEVYADRVCPGLDPAPDLAGEQATVALPEALAQAFATAEVAELEAHMERAQQVHQAFEQNAREAGVWDDPEEARWDALAHVAPGPQAWEEARVPFEAEEPERLPTMVLPRPSFPWRMWRIQGDEAEALSFTETGELRTEHRVALPEPPGTLPDAVRTTLHRLVGLEGFVGAAFDLVDASAYSLPVTAAVQKLVDQVAASLLLRIPLLQAEGLEPTAEALAASYEPEFFDLPSIGGWL
ncbi:MAG: YkgJ family cysteine cluster protein [Candidatus Thermoplasmatota archaeon]|nr:YkgJ family cysteine cluster protein [Candidatus Thermoplasmatota archaeon]